MECIIRTIAQALNPPPVRVSAPGSAVMTMKVEVSSTRRRDVFDSVPVRAIGSAEYVFMKVPIMPICIM